MIMPIIIVVVSAWTFFGMSLNCLRLRQIGLAIAHDFEHAWILILGLTEVILPRSLLTFRAFLVVEKHL
jgi:hypothetical protein